MVSSQNPVRSNRQNLVGITLVILLLLQTVSSLFSQKYNLLPDTIRYCLGNDAPIEIISHFGSKTTVSWETPLGKFANTRKVKPTKAGKYFVKVTSPQFVYPLIDSAYVRVYEMPTLNIKDTVLCKGRALMVDAKNVGSTYLWSTGESTQRIKISNPGRYWVKITNGSCFYTDTVRIKSPEGSLVSLSNETSFCLNEDEKMISIKTGKATRIKWNTGSTSPSITVTKAGTYWVTTETTGCGVQTDSIKVKFKACDCELFIPNSFTPNEDNRNDYFFPVAQCEYSYYQITISDRWGNVVFMSGNVNTKWDGRFKGNLCPEDIYVYIIESTEKLSDRKNIRKGHISLFR
jgi:gliding motility-associated-like protein